MSTLQVLYVCMLLTFSVMVLTELPKYSSHAPIGSLEIVIWIWIATLILEEFDQVSYINLRTASNITVS